MKYCLPYIPLLANASSYVDSTPWKKLSSDYISIEKFRNLDQLIVDREALRILASAAFTDMAYFLRASHLQQLSNILKDPEASENDKFVALQLLKNANIAAGKIFPGCQDTGTAIVAGYKGQGVFTVGNTTEEQALSEGIKRTYTEQYLRYSQMQPLTVYDEKNTKTNLPAQIDLYATEGNEYRFLFMAKGGGSANKTFLYQMTKAVLNPKSLRSFLIDEIKKIGTSACPPYHLAVVIGGTSAEATLKTVKYASARYLDGLPSAGGTGESYAFRDHQLEQELTASCHALGIGAQFGGKYFVHDVRCVRLPRHGASCPVGIGVSCSADRQVLGKISAGGVFLEQLEENPAQFLPDVREEQLLPAPPVRVDLRRPMAEIRRALSGHPVGTRLSLSGPLVVARDIAHARVRDRLRRGEPMPAYFTAHAVYYAGPAKTPAGRPAGSFGPTTAGRMDQFVDLFQQHGGALVTLAKGNRAPAVAEACRRHGGFYLGSIGGPAAVLAVEHIRRVEVLDMPEEGMEAVWKIEVVDFPAFIVIDDKGNDFFKQLPCTL